MLTLAVFTLAAVMGGAGLLLDWQGLTWAAMTTANIGLVLVVLSDNGKTRRVLRGVAAEVARANDPGPLTRIH